MRRIFSFLVLMILVACSCSSSGKRASSVRIGVDPTWGPLNFGPLQPYVNGYTEDLLLEIAHYSGLKFEKVFANGDTLFEELLSGKYEAVLSSLPPYTFNEAKYDFSANFLNLGPVLIIPRSSSFHNLENLTANDMVGVLQGDPATLLIQKYPSLIVRYYNSILELLDAVSQGEISAALLDRIKAVAYVNDLYQTTLRVASKPLDNQGLHLIQLKGKNASFFHLFEKSLKAFEEKKRPEALQKKWRLGFPTSSL